MKLHGRKLEAKELLPEEMSQKLQVMLSVDQLAIFLRAAVDSKIIANVAYNWVAGELVPYLATKNTSNIGLRSIRSKGSVNSHGKQRY